MQQNDDDLELRRLLRQWQAPETPVLEQRLLALRGQSWWRFVLTGYIRVPVSVACLLAMLVTGVVWKVAVRAAAPCAIDRAAAEPVGAGAAAASSERCGHLVRC